MRFFLILLILSSSASGYYYTTTQTCNIPNPGFFTFIQNNLTYKRCSYNDVNLKTYGGNRTGTYFLVGDGIDTTHPELVGRSTNILICENTTLPIGFHDTAMAAIMAGINLSAFTPSLNISIHVIGLKVDGCDYKVQNSSLFRGFKYVYDQVNTGIVQRPAVAAIAQSVHTDPYDECFLQMFYENGTMKSNPIDCYGETTNMIKLLFNIGVVVFHPAENGYADERDPFPFAAFGFDICKAYQFAVTGQYDPFFASPVFKRSSTNKARPINVGSLDENFELSRWMSYSNGREKIFETGASNYGACIELYVPTTITLLAFPNSTFVNRTLGDFELAGVYDYFKGSNNTYNVSFAGIPLGPNPYLCYKNGIFETSWSTAIASLYFMEHLYLRQEAPPTNGTSLDDLITYVINTGSNRVTRGMRVHPYFPLTTVSQYNYKALRNPLC